MKAAAWRRGSAVLFVALGLLAPARSGVAQVTTTSTTAVVTTTSTSTTSTSTTSTSTTSTTVPFPVVLPFDPFPTLPDVTTGPPVTGVTIPVTVTTVEDLPFSTPFTRATTTTTEPIEPSTTAVATTSSTTTTTAPAPPATSAPALEVAARPAPAVVASPEAPSRAWVGFAGAGLVLAGAGAVTWRRWRETQRR